MMEEPRLTLMTNLSDPFQYQFYLKIGMSDEFEVPSDTIQCGSIWSGREGWSDREERTAPTVFYVVRVSPQGKVFSDFPRQLAMESSVEMLEEELMELSQEPLTKEEFYNYINMFVL